MRDLLILLLLFLVIQCRNNSARIISNASEDTFYDIDYEKSLQNKEIIQLSEIASVVNYIPLQTDSNCLLFSRAKYYFSDQYIFISNLNHILVFDYSGKFIRQIGTPGNGPNEIDIITSMTVLPNEEIIVIQTNWSNNLLFFTFNGTIIKSISKPILECRYKAVNDSLMILQFSCAIGIEDYLYMLVDLSWDTLSTVDNHFKWENNTGITGMWSDSNFKPFYWYKEQIFFKSMYNDTIYTVKNEKIHPSYFIDLGKYKLPNELRPEPPQSAMRFRKESKDFSFASVFNTEIGLFISTYNYNSEIKRNLFFKKNSAEPVFLVNKYDKSSGFINDLDGGPEFWPEGNVNDQTVYMVLEPFELKEMVKEESNTNNEVIFSDKMKEFIEIVNVLEENDNPVIMRVSLK